MWTATFLKLEPSSSLSLLSSLFFFLSLNRSFVRTRTTDAPRMLPWRTYRIYRNRCGAGYLLRDIHASSCGSFFANESHKASRDIMQADFILVTFNELYYIAKAKTEKETKKLVNMFKEISARLCRSCIV